MDAKDPQPHPNPTYREAAKERRTLSGGTSHPLGVDADPTIDYCTPSVRRNLEGHLYGYYAGTFGQRLNKGEAEGDSRVGLPLADRFVSRAEIGAALRQLRDYHNHLYTLIYLTFSPTGN